MASGRKLPLCLHSQVAIFLQNAQCLYRFCQVPPAGCSLMILSCLCKLYRRYFITCHRNPIATVYLSQVLFVMSSLSSDKQTLQCHIGIVRFACLGVPPPISLLSYSTDNAVSICSRVNLNTIRNS